MQLSALNVMIFLAIAAWIQHIIQYRRRNTAGLPLPAGPKGLPFVGNIFNFPKTEAWLTAIQWRKKFGDLVYLQVLGKRVIFVNSYATTIDLLDKRALKYSGRPEAPMLTELMGWGWTVNSMQYGPTHRKHRAYLHRFLQPAAMKKHYGVLTLEAHRLIANLLDSPDNYLYHIRRTMAATIMMIAYGHEVASEGDTFVKLANDAVESFSIAAEPGAFLVDFLPILKYVPAWFPGAGFKRQAEAWLKLSQNMLNVPYSMTKRKILDGTARSSMMSDLIEINTDKDGYINSEDDIAACAAVTYAGGSDTTVSSIISFLLALVLYPEVGKRGQEELHHVIGRDQLPTFENRPSLPYINGIVKETLRWNPVVPGGAPHTLDEDDIYNGYFIPAGTIFLPNNWAMLHDEMEYPKPLEFKPERWVLKGGQKEPRDPTKVAFGFGRRICPGKDLAEDTIYIIVATILATLDVQKAVDAHGQPITPPGDYHKGFISHPKPFKCAITPHSPEIVGIIHQVIENETREVYG